MDTEDPYRSSAIDPSKRMCVGPVRNPNRFASFFKRMYGKHSKALSIILAVFVAFSLIAIKYPMVAAKFGEGTFVCMVGALGLVAGVFGIWLAGMVPHRIGWYAGRYLNWWNEPALGGDRWTVMGPIPWIFGVLLFGVPIGAYCLGTILLSCLH